MWEVCEDIISQIKLENMHVNYATITPSYLLNKSTITFTRILPETRIQISHSIFYSVEACPSFFSHESSDCEQPIKVFLRLFAYQIELVRIYKMSYAIAAQVRRQAIFHIDQDFTAVYQHITIQRIPLFIITIEHV